MHAYGADQRRIIKVFSFDLVLILSALIVSVGVRSQFEYFLFDLQAGASLFPMVLVLRIVVLFLSDEYATGFSVFPLSHIIRLALVNLIPSVIVIALRFTAPVAFLRMPLTMIAVEYSVTTLLMIMLRVIVSHAGAGNDTAIGYRRRVLLWAYPEDLRTSIGSIAEFARAHALDVRGILNRNPVSWNSEIEGVRVFGDESRMTELLAEDDRISTLLIFDTAELSRSRAATLADAAGRLRMDVAILDSGAVQVVRRDELIERCALEHSQ
ncbi:MAG: hypothetical protein ACLFNQ_13780 [Spirochaetaceae bacterium]